MCGRFTLTEDLKALAKQFDVPLPPPFASYAPRFNIAPTQSVIVVTEEGNRQMVQMRWGLIPSWAKDPSIGNRIINARAETLAAKPAYPSSAMQYYPVSTMVNSPANDRAECVVPLK